MRITNVYGALSGNIGINTSYPNQQLTVNGSISATGFVYASSATFTGNVGINTANPNQALTVNGSISASGTITGSTGASIPVSFGITTSNGYNFMAAANSYVDNVYTVPAGYILIPVTATFIYDTVTGGNITGTYPSITLIKSDHITLTTPTINNGNGQVVSLQYQSVPILGAGKATNYFTGGETVSVKLLSGGNVATALSGRLIFTGHLV